MSLTVSIPFVSGRLNENDDFLTVLSHWVSRCDMLELDTEVEYVVESMDLCFLHGEGNLSFVYFS